MSELDFVSKEQARQELITKAVKAAEEILGIDSVEDPDVKSYLLYKTGAQMLMKGLAEGIDRRVMLSDMGFTNLVAVDAGEPKRTIAKVAKLCKCGRLLLDDPELLLCSGCFCDEKSCQCKKLSTQYVPNEEDNRA